MWAAGGTLAACSLALLLAAQPLAGQVTTPPVADSTNEHLLYVSLFTGGAWPVGVMNTVYDPSFAAGGRVEVSMGPLVRLGVELSFHSFDAERASEIDNEGAINLSLFGKALGRWGPYQPFALLGLGAYVTKEMVSSGRRWDGGVQVGGGFELPISEHLSALVAADLHAVLRGGEQKDYVWIDGYLGFVFRQP